jgi:hypothetical protein
MPRRRSSRDWDFSVDQGNLDDYRLLSDGLGGFIHLNRAIEGWLQAGRNPFGLYLYREDVDGAARAFAGETIGQPGDTPWGMYELTVLTKLLCASAGRPVCVDTSDSAIATQECRRQ